MGPPSCSWRWYFRSARTVIPRQFGSGYGKRPNGWKTNWGKSATFSLMAASKTGMSFQSRPYRLSLGSMAVMSMQKTNGREPKDGIRRADAHQVPEFFGKVGVGRGVRNFTALSASPQAFLP